MNKTDAKNTGYDYGYSAGRYCEVGESDKNEACCGCAGSDDSVCEDCLSVAAYESEQNARQFSPWEFVAHDINECKNSESLWEAYDKGVSQGIKAAIKERLKHTGK